jgi:hypothetical protein
MSRIFAAVLALVASVIGLAGLPDDAVAQKRVAFVVGTDKGHRACDPGEDR